MKVEEYFNPVTFLLIRDEALNLWDEIAMDLKKLDLQYETDLAFPIGSLELIQKVQFKIVTALHYSGMILNLYERLKELMKSNEKFTTFISKHSRADKEIINMILAVDRANNIQKHLLMADVKEKNDAFVGVVKDDRTFYWVRDNVNDLSSIKGKKGEQVNNYDLLLSQRKISLTIPKIKDSLFGIGIPRIVVR